MRVITIHTITVTRTHPPRSKPPNLPTCPPACLVEDRRGNIDPYDDPDNESTAPTNPVLTQNGAAPRDTQPAVVSQHLRKWRRRLELTPVPAKHLSARDEVGAA